jgi:hypothetical protein
MNRFKNMHKMKVGMEVLIKHDLGLEIGQIESINPKSGKVLVHFDYVDCPHYATFNLDQIMSFEVRS